MHLTCTARRSCRLLSLLRRELGLSSTLVSRLKFQNAFLVNGQPVHTNYPVVPGDEILVLLDEPEPDFPPEPGPLSILYEDQCLLALDKPAGCMVHPTFHRNTGTLANYVLAYYQATGQRCGVHPVNRLDRDTFGVVLLAKNAHIHALCCKLLQQGAVEKTYEALVLGNPEPARGQWDIGIRRLSPTSLLRTADPDGQAAATQYQLAEALGPCSRLLLHPLTGRTHQLRVHCRYFGVPILGDPQYATEDSARLSGLLGLTTQQLLARSLRLPHPLSGIPLEISSRQTVFRPDFSKKSVFPVESQGET